MSKFALGPWIADGTVVLQNVGIQIHIAYCHDANGRPLADNALANVRLIAAAPELLAALKDALSGWRYIRRRYGDLDGVGWDRVEKAARAAIAKAAGEGK